MRKCLLVLATLCLLQSAAPSDMIIAGGALPYRHDRYYVGADKAFIGQPYDWSGVGMSTSGGRFATMISPSYFISANHSRPGIGENVHFSNGNEWSAPGYFEATVVSGVQIGLFDLWLGKLSSPVTENIAKYPIYVVGTPSSPTEYLNKSYYLYGCPSRVGKNVMSFNGQAEAYYHYDYYNGPADECYFQGGDSGGPSFGLVNGQLAVVGIHYAINGSDSIDTFVPAYLNELLAAMGGELFRVGPANYWKGGTGNWSTSSNWTMQLPVVQADVVVNNGGAATYSSGTMRYNSLLIGSGGSGALTLSGGNVTISDTVVVGEAGMGTFTQSGGTLSAGAITLGKSASGNGTYSLSGSAALTVSSLVIADAGAGTFTQSVSALNIPSLTVGKSAGSNGNYNLSGTAQYSATTAVVGDAGVGAISQSANTCTAGSMTLGRASTGRGTYTLGGGVFNPATLYVGDAGVGTFTHTAGSLGATGVTLGKSAGGSGSYGLSGAGSLSVGTLIVGDAGAGSFTQSAGTCTVTSDLILGKAATSTGGSYRISGGSLTAKNLTIGGAGAGTLAIDNSAANIFVSGALTLGAAGNLTAVTGSSLKLNGGTLANTATDATRYAGLNNLNLVLSSATGQTQTIEAGGKNIGLSGGGFTNNFKLASLQVGSAGAPVNAKLVDLVHNVPGQVGKDALHVDNLSIAAGSTLDLGGLNLYYHTASKLGTINLNGGHLEHDNLKTVHVWLDVEQVPVGSEYAVGIWAQIIGGLPGEGFSDLGITVYSPLSVGATVPLEVGLKPTVATVWNPQIAANYFRIDAIPQDSDNDGDTDALQMCFGSTGGGSRDLGNAPVLIATQTWIKLADFPVGLAVSVQGADRHYDPILGKQTFAWPVGDLSHDGTIGATDIDQLYRNFGGGSACDLNGDGLANQADVDFLVKTILQSGYGDSNFDRKIDFTDFQVLLDNWQKSGGWAQADFTGDGKTDFLDFQKLLDNWNPTGFSGAPVPEPATLVWLALGGLALLRRNRMA